MAVKMSFRDSKDRNGRGRSSRNGGENMDSSEGGRVRIKKGRSFGNGDEGMSSKDERGRRSFKGGNSGTERRDRDSSSRKARDSSSRSFGNGGGNMNSNSRGRIRSSGDGDGGLNFKDRRGGRGMTGQSSRTERRDGSSRNEMTDSDDGEEIEDNEARNGRVNVRKSRSSGNGGGDRRSVGMRKTRSSGNGDENINLKRKRVYANEIETAKGKSMLKFARNEVRALKEKRMRKEKFEILGEAVEKKSVRSKLRVKTIVEDEGKDGTYKREGREKTETRKKENEKKLGNKNFGTKKVVGNDKDEEADQAKKKKRMRIDPYDFSNKRMDDGFIAKDGEEKKKDLPKPINTAELSMNAQFRAICPSQSILSYVEDNLLGRRREIEIKRAGYNIDLSFPLDNIPFSTSSERERIEEPAFRNRLEFFAAAKQSSSFPPLELPEIAFAGRSNVGKSSMLNALTRQWGVVRTSDKPGLTQSINFFKLGSKLCLVDLPGYGFAYAKDEAKEAWEELVKEYVSTRVGLKRVCLLVDTKWGMKQRDYELVDLMERSKTKYQIVLTKTDLVFPVDVARRAMQIEESLKGKKSAVQPAMMVSSRSGAGIRSFRTALSKIARFLKP